MSDFSGKPPQGGGDEGGEPGSKLAPSSTAVRPGAVVVEVDAVNAARSTLDINFDVLLRLAAQGKAAEDGLALVEKALELREKYESQRVKHFREITQAVNEAKERDPDDVDRREANKYRRGLMSFVALVMLAAVAATIYIAVTGGEAAAFAGMAGISILSMVMVAVLASGGQLSVRNLTGLITAMAAMQTGEKIAKPPGGSGGRRSKQGGRS